MWSSCSCGSLVRLGSRCPTCGGSASPSRSAAAVLLGLGLAGCPLVKEQPLYGATVTDSVEPDADTDADTDTDAETGDTGG